MQLTSMAGERAAKRPRRAKTIKSDVYEADIPDLPEDTGRRYDVSAPHRLPQDLEARTGCYRVRESRTCGIGSSISCTSVMVWGGVVKTFFGQQHHHVQ